MQIGAVFRLTQNSPDKKKNSKQLVWWAQGVKSRDLCVAFNQTGSSW